MKRVIFLAVLLLAVPLIIQWFILLTREPVVRCDGGEIRPNGEGHNAR